MSLGELKYRLITDALCYLLITLIALHFEHTTIAAWVGAFGIVYAYRGILKYAKAKKEIEDFIDNIHRRS